MIVDIVDKYCTDDNNPIKNLRLKGFGGRGGVGRSSLISFIPWTTNLTGSVPVFCFWRGGAIGEGGE